MFEKLRNLFKRDDLIHSAEDLQKVFEDVGMPNIKIFTVDKEPEIRIYNPEEKLRIQLDARKGMK